MSTTNFDVSQFKDKKLIFCVLHYNFTCVELTLKNILKIIEKDTDLFMVLFDSRSSDDIRQLFNTINHPRIHKISLPINFGYNTSVNFYIKDFINKNNLPKTIIRMDADILFSQKDFNTLCEAIENLPRFGVLGLSWKKNNCNPQMNTFFKPKTFKGLNSTSYKIRMPFLTPIAGGIMAIKGSILEYLDYELFQPRLLPKQYLKVLPVGGADSALYNALKGKWKMGYIENTTAYHLKSRDNTIINIPKDFEF